MGGDIPSENVLWVSDGSTAGTRHVATDLISGSSTLPFAIFALSDRIVFPRDTIAHGRELWWTDGNRLELVADIAPGPGSGIPESFHSSTQVLRNKLFFGAETPATGIEPWVSDGTTDGTAMLDNLAAETRTLDGVERLLGHTTQGVFFSGCKTTDDCELWISDGSSAGTREVIDLDATQGTHPREGYAFDDRLFFTNNSGGLWVSDGSAMGTRKLGEMTTREFVGTSSGLVFSAEGNNNAGVELWRTDGSEIGTVLLADVIPGSPSSSPTRLTLVGDWVYFVAYSLSGRRSLSRIDPSSGAMELVGELANLDFFKPDQLTPLGNDVVFAADDPEAGTELWRSNGLTISRVADINPGATGSDAGNFARYGDEVFFRATDATSFTLWATDGDNVRKVVTVMAAEIDDPGYLSVINHKLYFSASAHADRQLLSVLDSPNAVVRSIDGPEGNLTISPRSFRRLDADWAFFSAATGFGQNPHITNGQRVLWLSDAVDLRYEAPISVESGPHAGVWFVGYSDAAGQELWRLK